MGVFVRKTALGAVLASMVVLALAGAAQAAWSPVGALSGGRYNHTATLLKDGRVLVAGGSNSGALKTAQLYDSHSNTWSNAAPMNVARAGQAAVRLDSGKVLVAGGVMADGTAYTATAEVYDPTDGTWTAVGDMATARFQPTMTLLKDGASSSPAARRATTARRRSRAPRCTTRRPELQPRRVRCPSRARNATATLLPNGKVLVAGGYDDAKHELASAELYDPAANSWSPTEPLATARRLRDGDLASERRRARRRRRRRRRSRAGQRRGL